VDTRLTPARRQPAAALPGPFPGAGHRRGGIALGRADLHVHSHAAPRSRCWRANPRRMPTPSATFARRGGVRWPSAPP